MYLTLISVPRTFISRNTTCVLFVNGLRQVVKQFDLLYSITVMVLFRPIWLYSTQRDNERVNTFIFIPNRVFNRGFTVQIASN